MAKKKKKITSQKDYKSMQAMAKDHMGLSSSKAKKILKDGSVRGHKLTAKQMRYMGWVAGGRKSA